MGPAAYNTQNIKLTGKNVKNPIKSGYSFSKNIIKNEKSKTPGPGAYE